MARRIQLTEFGGPDVLRVSECADPEPPERGYVIRARAIGLNFAETVERRGAYKRGQELPYPMGKEAAGEIVARGPEATSFAIGDPVIVVKFDNGCYADFVTADEDQVLWPPRGLDWPEMAAFANTYGTAWYAMHEVARVRSGESALIQAAAGGVGTAAVQLARSHGCGPVIGTAGTDQKCARVEQLGAHRCVNYRSEDFRAAVRELTGGQGVDYCLESVGGEVYEQSLELLAPMGRMVVIGFSAIREDYANAIKRLHPLTLFHRSILVGGLHVDNLKYQARRAIWDRLVDHAEEHALKPVVGATFAFDEAPAAHEALEGRRTHGKVVLIP